MSKSIEPLHSASQNARKFENMRMIQKMIPFPLNRNHSSVGYKLKIIKFLPTFLNRWHFIFINGVRWWISSNCVNASLNVLINAKKCTKRKCTHTSETFFFSFNSNAFFHCRQFSSLLRSVEQKKQQKQQQQ